MPRHTHTAKAAKARPSVLSSAGDLSTTSKPARKAVRGRQGAFQVISKMPREIIVQVCTKVGLKELLWLSRTNHFFRTMLMDKGSEYIWKEAAEREGLPAPPVRLSYVRYAAMLANTRCQYCNSVAGAMSWELRMQICSHCRETMLLTVPAEDQVGGFRPCLLGERDHDFNIGREVTHFVLADVAALSARRQAIELREDLNDDEVEEQWQAVLDEREIDLEDARRFRGDLQDYFEKLKSEREDEMQGIRTQRRERVRQHFEDAGYEEMDISLVVEEPAVKQAEILTDRKWSNLKSKLTVIIDSHRDRRLARLTLPAEVERRWQIAVLWSRHPRPANDHYDFEPILGELFAFPAVAAVLADKTIDPIKRQDVAGPFTAYASVMYDWCKPTLASIEKLTGGSIVSTDAFSCRICNYPSKLRWPDLLSHRCFRIDCDRSLSGPYKTSISYESDAKVAAPFDIHKVKYAGKVDDDDDAARRYGTAAAWRRYNDKNSDSEIPRGW